MEKCKRKHRFRLIRIVSQGRVPLEEVFEQLRTSRAGLSSADAEARLVLFGPNKLEEKPVIPQFSISY